MGMGQGIATSFALMFLMRTCYLQVYEAQVDLQNKIQWIHCPSTIVNWIDALTVVGVQMMVYLDGNGGPWEQGRHPQKGNRVDQT